MTTTLQAGELTLTVVSGGTMRVDGGNVFGVVPRSLWQRECTPDELNRIAMAQNCLLVQGHGRTLLVDAGYGPKWNEKARGHADMQPGNPIVESLAQLGVAPEQVDTVVLTHLHNDHAGGTTTRDTQGNSSPVFTNARHLVQRIEWDDASGRLPELAGAYFEQDFVPLMQAGVLDLLDGEAEIIAGMRVTITGGHTRGHQMVVFDDGQREIIYPCDLCPTASHLHTNWCLAYDQHMRETRRVKPAVLGRAADRGDTVLFAHDPQTFAATIRRDDRRHFVVDQVLGG